MVSNSLFELLEHVERCFLEFLSKFRRSALAALHYAEISRQMLQRGSRVLLVDLDDLAKAGSAGDTLSFDPSQLRCAIMSRFLSLQPALDAAVTRFIVNVGESTDGIDIDLVRGFMVAFANGALTDEDPRRSMNLGCLQTIRGRIAGAADVTPEVVGDVPGGVVDQAIFSDRQVLRLQFSQGADSLTVLVVGEFCGRFDVGNEVLATGCLAVSRGDLADAYVVSPRLRGNRGRSLARAFFFNAVYIQEAGGTGNRQDSTPETKERDSCREQIEENVECKQNVPTSPLRQPATSCESILAELARAVAPSVHGHPLAKMAILLMLLGAVPKDSGDGFRRRGSIHICLVGETGTAKSAFLNWAAKVLPSGVFVSGCSSTTAGLTVSVHKDHGADSLVVLPGALMSADICCIDDFDRMDPEVRVALREPLEHQTITIAKAGLHRSYRVDVSVLAASSFGDNCSAVSAGSVTRVRARPCARPCAASTNFQEVPLSCFDLVVPVRDDAGSSDEVVASHIVELHRGGRAASADSSASLLRRIREGRALDPGISADAEQRLTECYSSWRTGSVVRIATPRHLESLLRLSEATARATLSREVSADHVEAALGLMRSSLSLEEALSPSATPGKELGKRARTDVRRG